MLTYTKPCFESLFDCLGFFSAFVKQQSEVLGIHSAEVLVVFFLIDQHLDLFLIGLDDCSSERSNTVELCDHNTVFVSESMVQNCLLGCCETNAQSDGSGFVRF